MEKMKKEKVRREEVEREKESMTPDYGPNGVVPPESGPGTGNPNLPSPFHPKVLITCSKISDGHNEVEALHKPCKM